MRNNVLCLHRLREVERACPSSSLEISQLAIMALPGIGVVSTTLLTLFSIFVFYFLRKFYRVRSYVHMLEEQGMVSGSVHKTFSFIKF